MTDPVTAARSDVDASLARSIAALTDKTVAEPGGPRPGTQEWRDLQEEPPAPLWFDAKGKRWTRRDRTAFDDGLGPTGDQLPVEQIGAGWRVFSLRQLGPEGDGGLGRDGICVDVEADDDGERLYVCVAHWRNNVGRLPVVRDDVQEAVPASRRTILDLRRTVFRAMSDKPMGLVVVGDAAWLAGAAVRLGGLADG